AQIPIGQQAGNYIVEQIPPVSTWGKKYYITPLAQREGGELYRYVASENNTQIFKNGQLIVTLSKGIFFEELLSEACIIESNKPILVVQYSRGLENDEIKYHDQNNDLDFYIGDPSMLLISPFEQYNNKYNILTSDRNDFVLNYINLIVPYNSIGEVTHNGEIIE